MRDAVSQRYIDPEGLYEDDESEHERKMAEVKKAKGLKALEDTKWLPNLLNEVLENTTITWDAISITESSSHSEVFGKRKWEIDSLWRLVYS